jgi:hypothetical protein
MVRLSAWNPKPADTTNTYAEMACVLMPSAREERVGLARNGFPQRVGRPNRWGLDPPVTPQGLGSAVSDRERSDARCSEGAGDARMRTWAVPPGHSKPI